MVFVNSHSFKVRIVHCLFCWIPIFVTNVLKNFENCSQRALLVGNRFNGFCEVALVLGTRCFVLVGSQLSGLKVF